MAEKRTHAHLSAASHKATVDKDGNPIRQRSGATSVASDASEAGGSRNSPKTGESPLSQPSQGFFEDALGGDGVGENYSGIGDLSPAYFKAESSSPSASSQPRPSHGPAITVQDSEYVKANNDFNFDDFTAQFSGNSPAKSDLGGGRLSRSPHSQIDWDQFGVEVAQGSERSPREADRSTHDELLFLDLGTGEAPSGPLRKLSISPSPASGRPRSDVATTIAADTEFGEGLKAQTGSAYLYESDLDKAELEAFSAHGIKRPDPVPAYSYDTRDTILSDLDKAQLKDFSEYIVKELASKSARNLTTCLTHELAQTACPSWPTERGYTFACGTARDNRATVHWLDALNRHAQTIPSMCHPFNDQDAQTINFTREVEQEFGPDFRRNRPSLSDGDEPSKVLMASLRETRGIQHRAVPWHPVFHEQSAKGIPTEATLSTATSGTAAGLISEEDQINWAIAQSLKSNGGGGSSSKG
ncbi:hypothetical protein I317_04498 [Kwoniella heveanensis CBS 569]|nr:hypothetical protein I317_04498 [Kwoniella heveanensis CBS 569]